MEHIFEQDHPKDSSQKVKKVDAKTYHIGDEPFGLTNF